MTDDTTLVWALADASGAVQGAPIVETGRRAQGFVWNATISAVDQDAVWPGAIESLGMDSIVNLAVALARRPVA